LHLHYLSCVSLRLTEREIYLDVSRPLNVLAVIAPVPGRAEPLRSQHPVEDAGHLDAVLGIVDVTAVRVVLEMDQI